MKSYIIIWTGTFKIITFFWSIEWISHEGVFSLFIYSDAINDIPCYDTNYIDDFDDRHPFLPNYIQTIDL